MVYLIRADNVLIASTFVRNSQNILIYNPTNLFRARDWPNRVTCLNVPQLKTGEYPMTKEENFLKQLFFSDLPDMS